MTAARLLDALTAAGCRPSVDGQVLLLYNPPAELEPLAAVLQTGLRSILTGRPWRACGPNGGACGPSPARGFGPLAHGALDPSAPLPPGVALLSVAGDKDWDRVSAWAPMDFPDLYAAPDALADTGGDEPSPIRGRHCSRARPI